jgi:phosphoserine aminotransferase
MYSFYPGPSQTHEFLAYDLLQAHSSGLLSVNHRSTLGMELILDCKQAVKKYFDLPKNYEVYLLGSATECWETIAQSFPSHTFGFLSNGAFGKKWCDYTQKLVKQKPSHVVFDHNETPPIEQLPIADILCLTHCETSNGTELSNEFLTNARATFAGLICLDATSSMAGKSIPFAEVDITFASVQKCFGLPAGMAVMILSPNAIESVAKNDPNKHYNSLRFMGENFKLNQTPFTPNMLGIYLLKTHLERAESQLLVYSRLKSQAALWYTFLENHAHLKPLVNLSLVRSQTVIAVACDQPQVLHTIFDKTEKAGFQQGKGYGPWANNSFRIANFPAHSTDKIEALKTILLDV